MMMQDQQYPDLIITSNARLARSLQQAFAQENISQQRQKWQPLNVKTLESWLDTVFTASLLCGEIVPNTMPEKCLTALEERLLWQEVIASSLKANIFKELFDLTGLAEACIEANRYMVAWRLRVASNTIALAEETRQFLIWQQLFQARCKALNVLESVRYFDWQIDTLAKGGIQLPSSIAFAGFDQNAPQETRLREVLNQCACAVSDYATGQAIEAQTQHLVLADQTQEMRCMAAWAKAQLKVNPEVNLALVVPDLATLRNQLADLLDDIFQPVAIRLPMAEAHRIYNFSLGYPLSQQAIIQTALDLIRLFSSHQLAQSDIGHLLRSPYWSASLNEADGRALLDAAMRENLAQNTTWPRLLRFMQQQSTRLEISNLLEVSEAALLHMQAQKRKQVPSAWVGVFRKLLQCLKWSGQRIETSHEYQAKQAWEKALQQLAQLDFLGDVISARDASQLLQQICKAQVFQPETNHRTSIQILGMMEALSSPVDAMWVMRMNDDTWPPPARPNPLLPAHIQRSARVANADSAVQAAFAQTIHQRLLHSAREIIFSSSLKEGEKALRASPLMHNIALSTLQFNPASTLAESLAAQGNALLSLIEDTLAPPVVSGEHVRGGTGLIRAQAICPAWAFYQFRLGAKSLKIAKNGLDAAERGQLVHGALEEFWQPHKQYRDAESRHSESPSDGYRHFADLQRMSDDTLKYAIDNAVQHAITAFTRQQDETFSPAILALEHERLCHLLAGWLRFELERQAVFKIQACEFEKKVNINGIEVTLKIDRVHQLADGGLELVDYKTGQLPKITSWGEDRITEPQLPIYAVFYADSDAHVAGVQFGLVKITEHHFSGVSENNFETDVEKRKPEFIRQFSDWEGLKSHWRNCIEATVQEIKQGYAAIIFESEAELTYCEAKPLLRLPERRLQFERQLEGDKTRKGAAI